MILVFLSLCLGALLSALYHFPWYWYLLFSIGLLPWSFFRRKNKEPLLIVSSFLLGAFLFSLNVLPSGEYEIVGFKVGSRITSGRVFRDGKWRKVRSMKIDSSEEGYIYAVGYFDGKVFHPTYVKTVNKPSLKTLKKSFSEKLSGSAVSLLFGEKNSEIYKSGLGHFYAVSGLHIGIAFSLYTTVVSFFTWRRDIQESVALLLLIPYVFSVGTPSVMRAYLTLGMWKIFQALEFKTTSSYITATVGSFMILLDPTVVFSPSFLLSFFVTLCILNSKGIFDLTIKAYLSALPFLCLFFGETNISTLLFSVPVSLMIIPVTWFAHCSFFLFLIGLKAPAALMAKFANVLAIPLDTTVRLANLFPVIPLPKFLYFILILIPLSLLFDIRDIFHRISNRASL
ncbi:ComEC/Rec2 family competence protein [Thermotoga sp. KOL6]|uniref:ComEC/Rec2 family competence protein n=1 Tax=Thermotoga sp. KOL6 TaxID=126741 RepID=UPI000C77CA07|nr:ComEC/Rec2 family competence protein [Thermotoga sp. KOL6]PLV60150.1 competence protein [Thermotoga sp. KOL6]